MIIKIARQVCLERYRIFPLRNYDPDKDEEVLFYPKEYKSYILTLSSKSFKGHTKVLGTELTRLAKTFCTDTTIFLGDTRTPWLYQHNDYNPVKDGQAYLANNKVGKRFNGALQVDKLELSTFVKHLAGMIRCNAALPYFHFVDEGQNFIGSICQYGNLHLDTLNRKANNTFKLFIDSSKFELGDKRNCYNWLGKTSGIPGRQTIV